MLRLPLGLKYDCPSPTTWQQAVSAFNTIIALGLPVARKHGQCHCLFSSRSVTAVFSTLSLFSHCHTQRSNGVILHHNFLVEQRISGSGKPLSRADRFHQPLGSVRLVSSISTMSLGTFLWQSQHLKLYIYIVSNLLTQLLNTWYTCCGQFRLLCLGKVTAAPKTGLLCDAPVFACWKGMGNIQAFCIYANQANLPYLPYLTAMKSFAVILSR